LLKNIANIFESKKNFLTKSHGKSSEIKIHLQEFFTSKFQSDLKGLSLTIDYDSRGGKLIIKTENKIIASELTLCLSELLNFLKGKKINLTSIIIR